MTSVRRGVPSWVHQVVGYVAGAIIVGFAIHSPSVDGPVLLIGAGLVAALALLAKGPLGVARILGSAALRLAELLVGLVLAVLPFFESGGPRLEVIVVLWVVAIAEFRLALFSGRRAISAASRREGGQPSPASPAAQAAADPAATALDDAVRRAGRRTGEAGRRVREVSRQAQPAMLKGARALGRAAGRRQAGRKGDDTT